MTFQTCPYHGSEDVLGVPLGDGAGSETFSCPRTNGHPAPGPHRWLVVTRTPETPTFLRNVVDRLQLKEVLPTIVASFGPTWVEYGLVEARYGQGHPDDFAYIPD